MMKFKYTITLCILGLALILLYAGVSLPFWIAAGFAGAVLIARVSGYDPERPRKKLRK
jgi:hypothetical protein